MVYDTRSNVFGVATLPLQELFDASVSSVSALTPVSAGLPAPRPCPCCPFTHRANPYSGTLLSYTLTLQHPLPSRASHSLRLRPTAALAAVMEDAAWSAVYELITNRQRRCLRCRGRQNSGCRQLELARRSPWANAEEASAETEVKQAEAEKEADKPLATRAREKSDAKPVKEDCKRSTTKPHLLLRCHRRLRIFRSRRCTERARDYPHWLLRQRWEDAMADAGRPRAGSCFFPPPLLPCCPRCPSLRQRQPGKTRLYSDGSLRFPSRLYPSCPAVSAASPPAVSAVFLPLSSRVSPASSP